MIRKFDLNLMIMFAGILLGGGLGFISWVFQRESKPLSNLQLFQVFDQSMGYPATDFELETLTGDVVRLSQYQGKPVLINFWATWCGPCQVEMPLIQEFYQKYASEMEVLAVDYDEPTSDVQAFIDKFGFSFPVLLDPGGKIADQYQVKGFPTTYFIDREGTVRGVYVGSLSRDLIVRYLKNIGVGQ